MTKRRKRQRPVQTERQVLAEASSPALDMVSGAIDDDDHLYRPLTGSRGNNLPQHTQDKILRVSRYLARVNPVANRLLTLISDFVLGEGIEVSGASAAVQDVVTQHWTGRYNAWDRESPARMRRFFKTGEYLMPLFINPVNGDVRVGSILSDRIKTVHTDPENWESVTEVELMPVTGQTEGVRYTVVNDFSADELAGVERPALWWSYGNDDGERGISLLYPIADYLDALDQFMFSEVERWLLLKAFVWDVTIKGATQDTINEMVKRGDFRTPTPSEVIVHNDTTEWQAKSPQLDTHDAANGIRLVRNHALGAVGIPEHWYAEGGDVNRACYSDDTETLTERGWRRYWEVEPGERIATYNPETREIEYHEPDGLYVYPFTGDMVRFKSTGVDVLVTPEHRMWVGYERNSEPPRWEITRAQDIEHARFLFASGAQWSGIDTDVFTLPAVDLAPGAGHGNADERVVPMDDWLEFLGYVISEGCIFEPGEQSSSRGRYKVSLSQNERVNPDKAAAIQACLDRLPFAFASYVGTDGTRRWQVSDKGLWTWLRREVGRFSRDKRIPQEFKDLSTRQLTILFEALMLGDGTADRRENRTNRSYSTNSTGLAGDVQEIATKLGLRARVRKATRCYSVEIGAGKPHVLTQDHIHAEAYDGTVYCFEVPNHLFVTRRNGYVAIHGNTATEMAEAPRKRLTALQEIWRNMMLDLLHVVVEYKVLFGQIPAELPTEDEDGNPHDEATPAREHVEVSMPDLSPDDQEVMAGVLSSLVASLMQAEDQGYVSRETSQRTVLMTLQQMGVDFNIEAEKVRIQADQNSRDAEREQDVQRLYQKQPPLAVVPPQGNERESGD